MHVRSRLSIVSFVSDQPMNVVEGAPALKLSGIAASVSPQQMKKKSVKYDKIHLYNMVILDSQQ